MRSYLVISTIMVVMVAIMGVMAREEEGCPGSTAAGNHWVSLTHDGDARRYLLHVPAGINASQPLALVVAWHGLSHDPLGFADRTRYSQLADSTKNYIVAYPEGVGASFNAGSCCSPARGLGIDDFGFARALVADVQKRTCIDAKKIYTTGYSNGCFMSQGLICLAPDLFKASACGSGGIILETECNDDFDRFQTSIKVLEIHGTLDATVPYNGNALLGFPPVPENYAANRERLECKAGPRKTFTRGRYACEEYYNCRDQVTVEQCTVTRGTHDWFDDDDFSNSEYILDFFGLRPYNRKGVQIE